MIEPLFNRIILKAVKEHSDSNILATPFVQYNDRGVVVNAGTSTEFKVGDTVIYEIRYSRDIRVEDEDYIVVNEEHIMARYEE